MQNFDIGQQLMRKQHWLRPLCMRIARHYGVDVVSGASDQRRLERSSSREQLRPGLLDVQTQVERDLVVAAAAGVKFASQRADLLNQLLLNRHEVVFCGGPHPAITRKRGSESYFLT